MRCILVCALICLLLCANTASGSAVDLVGTDSTVLASDPSFHVMSADPAMTPVFQFLKDGKWSDFSGLLTFQRTSTESPTYQCRVILKQGMEVTVKLGKLSGKGFGLSMKWYSVYGIQNPNAKTPSVVTRESVLSDLAGDLPGSDTKEWVDGSTEASNYFYFSFPTPSNVDHWEATFSFAWSKKAKFVWTFPAGNPCSFLSCKSGQVQVPTVACGNPTAAGGCLNGGTRHMFEH